MPLSVDAPQLNLLEDCAMYGKVLAAVDRSDMGHQVFAEALEIAKANQSRLMLLHVLSLEEDGSPGVPLYAGPAVYPIPDETYLAAYRQQWDDYEQAGLDLLRSLTDEAIAVGIHPEFTQNTGNPGRTICDLSRTWGADLIVMGRRGRAALTELFLGSVSNYVMHHAKCSVLIVQGQLAASTNASPQTAITSAR